MPTRVRPIHDLGPCVLTLESIAEITKLVEDDFQIALYTAQDGIWEIFEHSRDAFLTEIGERARLDSFRVVAQVDLEHLEGNGEASSESLTAFEQMARQYQMRGLREKAIGQEWREERYIEILFNAEEAKVKCDAPPTDEHWFEHFLLDLKKHVLRPSFRQRVSGRTEEIPYCRIVIHKKPPDPFMDNIKANLVSNLIWLLIGTLVALLVQWILHKFGIDLIHLIRF